MPATTEKIPDKIPFNVYAMLIILTFIFTGGATWMLGDDLAKTWHYFDKKEEWADRATHITTINKDPEKYPENFELTEIDRKEWDKAVKSLYPKETIEFPEGETYLWPSGYDPLQYSIQRDGDNLTASKDRPDMEKQAKLLLAADKGEKPAEAPKGDAPKTDAPKTDAPKADAPKADAPKDAPKADAPKEDAKPDAPKADK